MFVFISRWLFLDHNERLKITLELMGKIRPIVLEDKIKERWICFSSFFFFVNDISQTGLIHTGMQHDHGWFMPELICSSDSVLPRRCLIMTCCEFGILKNWIRRKSWGETKTKQIPKQTNKSNNPSCTLPLQFFK